MTGRMPTSFAIRCVALLAVAVIVSDSRADVDPSDLPEALSTLRKAESNHDLGIELLPTRPDEARAAFALAAADYDAVIGTGIDNAALHYNLGNALLRAGDRGGAIVELLRARALDPADPSIAANLAFARSQVPGRPTAGGDPSMADRLASWWHLVPLPTRAWGAVALWVVFWILLVLRQARAGRAVPPGRDLWPAAMGVVLVGSVVLAITVGIDLRDQHASDRAVVVATEVVLRKGNGDGFAPEVSTPLVSGIECQVAEERPGWSRVILDDGRSGWVPTSSLEIVGLRR
jgi:hypothetical protein